MHAQWTDESTKRVFPDIRVARCHTALLAHAIQPDITCTSCRQTRALASLASYGACAPPGDATADMPTTCSADGIDIYSQIAISLI